MKSKIILAVLFFSAQVFAQSSRTRATGETQSNSRGFTTGFVYSNLSDAKSKDESNVYVGGTRVDGSSSTESGGAHVGLYGLNLGFKDLYAFGAWGWDAGVQALKALNGSEFPQKVTIYKIYGDVAWPMTDMISLVGGINVSYFDGFASDFPGLKVEPGLGAQIGIETRLSNVNILLGGQVLTTTIKSDYSGLAENGVAYKGDSKSEATISGFIAQLGYTF